MTKIISTQALQRLPAYRNYLKSLPKEGSSNISAKAIAEALGLGEIQVRKDLAVASDKGKPKVGYVTEELLKDIEVYLGYDNVNDAILVGAGKLGRALLSYKGFQEYGLHIVAAFDLEEHIPVLQESETKIFALCKMKDLCERMKIRIGIITAPAGCAQEICDMLVNAGVLAIWNFAPLHLKVPDHILVQNEDMAASLASLSKHLIERLND